MLSKINRLQKTKDIERVFKKGIGLKGDFLFLKLIKNRLGDARFAFIISKKVGKKASFRNKIKRKLREAARSFLLRAGASFDAVIVAQKGIESKNFWEIKRGLEGLFKKSKII